MKKYFYLFLVSCITLSVKDACAQQDPQFSQYMFNPLAINPAYAGSRGMMNGALEFRKQWVGFAGAPTTMAVAINTPSKKGKVGLGLEIINDQIGPKSTTGAYFDYAYRIPLGKGKLAFGLGAGIMSYKVNWDKVTYKDAADGYDQLGTVKITKPDFKFGMYFNNKNFFVGMSYTHLNTEVYTTVQDSMTFTARMSMHGFTTVGRAFRLSDNLIFSPSIMIRSVGANTNRGVSSNAGPGGLVGGNVDINLNFRIKEMLWVGLSLRSEKSVIAMAMYNITDHLKLGYSYDMTFSRLKSYQSGSHEIVLGFDFNIFQSQTLSPRFF